MRAKQLYSLLARKTLRGRVVWYYRTYDDHGRRTTARSTGCESKTAAHAYCQKLLKEGRLIPDRPIRFADFARDFWVWDKCAYVGRKLARGATIGRSYVAQCRKRLEMHIAPTFARRRLAEITTRDIDTWVDRLLASGLSAGTTTQILGILKQMFAEAVRQGLIQTNPAAAAQGVPRVTYRHRGVLTPEELRALLHPDLEAWIGEPHAYALTVAAIATACRLGELLALRWSDVHADCLHIRHSLLLGTNTLKPTKTRQERIVPIPRCVSAILSCLGDDGPDVFVFSGTTSPLPHHTAMHRFRRALSAIEIPREEQLKRAVSFHSLRHMANSLLRGRVPDAILRLVTGHTTEQMTALYSHTLPDHLSAVREAQELVLPEVVRR